MSPTKIHLGKQNKSEDKVIKEEKNAPCSIKMDDSVMKHDLSNPSIEESICSTKIHRTEDVSAKQAGVLPNIPLQPTSESRAPHNITNRSKSVLINKATENESNLPQTNKVDVGSKSEKPKKSDIHSRDTAFTKGEVFANMKIETGDNTCSKVKSQNKTKVSDDKGLKQELVPDKGSCVDPVSDVVKVINVGRFCGMIIFVVVSLLKSF